MTVYGDRARFLRIVGSHLQRYPMMQRCDLYKLLHQAVTGSGHAIIDEYEAGNSFYREIDGLPAGPPEPILDIISDDGSMARINLRPYIAAEGDTDSLLRAFLKTSEVFEERKEKLGMYRDWLSDMSRNGQLPGSLAGMEDHIRSMERDGYPAVHHSRVYRERYAPAYRIILSELTGTLSIFPGEPLSPGLR
ncbi:MAG: hypothetical protein AVO35_07770 [Candidatus Aegiribacteria sp. MLS_C]|nr:MAG: hypothetical protein AVO35_07770 [Candidatus Aegiribacteria sp. MLS_C]